MMPDDSGGGVWVDVHEATIGTVRALLVLPTEKG